MGVSLPLLSATLGKRWQTLFFVIRATAGGVVLTTGFVHVLGDAVPVLSDPCLGLSSNYPWVRTDVLVLPVLLCKVTCNCACSTAAWPLHGRCMAAALLALYSCFSFGLPSPHLGATTCGSRSECRHLSSPPSPHSSRLCWSSTCTATSINAWRMLLASFFFTFTTHQKNAPSGAAPNLPAMEVHIVAFRNAFAQYCAILGMPFKSSTWSCALLLSSCRLSLSTCCPPAQPSCSSTDQAADSSLLCAGAHLGLHPGLHADVVHSSASKSTCALDHSRTHKSTSALYIPDDPKKAELQRLRYTTASITFECGVIFHSIFIGITLGITSNAATARVRAVWQSHLLLPEALCLRAAKQDRTDAAAAAATCA